MSVGPALDAGLALLASALAVWVVLARQAFGAVVGFVAFGLVLSLAWLRLGAVDVALTEAAIGSGVTGAVLLAAVTRLHCARPVVAAARCGRRTRAISIASAGLVSAGLAALVLSPTDPAPTLAPQAAAALPELGVGNAITGILLAYRSVDTLLEKIVLLLALAGIWSLARDGAWGDRPAPPGSGRRDGTLTLLGQVLPPLGIVAGIYIVWVGADAPGGAFQGGAILAAMWILALMARLADPPVVGRIGVRLAVGIGPIVFLAIGFAGFALPGGFLSYPAGFAKPLIIVIEVALTFSIAVVLGLLVLGPSARGTQR
ncbi:MAG TPA: hydrogenase subunit MbhD domain-containing protein [Acetobacteraceae bacterium]|nr:hydrogenase subunit MbhD domain-containing protein [Acetobacteraceae bacterium]